MKKELLLIKISGPDQPGITAGLMRIISDAGHSIADIGQSITHGLLSLSILIDTSSKDNNKNQDVIKELLFTAKKLGVDLDFEVIDDSKELQVRGDKYIISCVSNQGISAHFIAEIATYLASHQINIQRIDNVTENKCHSLDIAATALDLQANWEKIKQDLLSISNQCATDIAILRDNVWRRNKRLIVFDMDSTLIQSEVIVEMAKRHGVGEQVHHITEQAMNGVYNFDEALIERVKLLEGLSASDLHSLISEIKLTEGTEEFIKTVKSLGYKLAVISGGFSFFTSHFKEKLGLDYAFGNDLEIVNGKLTGKVKGDIVNADRKAMLLELIAQQEGLNLEQVVAIGDGANDLKMLSKAGLGIAFHAKDIVKQSANHSMSHGPMTSILYFLGIPGPQNCGV